jgi:cyclase
MPHLADPKETQDLIAKANHLATRLLLKGLHPGALAIAEQLHQDCDFEGIRLVLPTTVFEDRHVLNLEGTEVHLICVGPCHQTGDTLIDAPGEGGVFTGDAIFHECAPMGWNGSCRKWMEKLDFIISLEPKVIVPGHGPVCGVEAVVQRRACRQYVRAEAKPCFRLGPSAMDASKKIDFGPYAGWRAPARSCMNVERAYRELCNEAGDTPWDHAKNFDHLCEVPQARGCCPLPRVASDRWADLIILCKNDADPERRRRWSSLTPASAPRARRASKIPTSPPTSAVPRARPFVMPCRAWRMQGGRLRRAGPIRSSC